MHNPSTSNNLLETQLRFLKITLAIFSLVLLKTTWQLWVPQNLFPQVPLFSWILNLPTWVDWLTFLVMVISSAGILAIVLISAFFQIQNSELWQTWQRVCGGLFFSAFLISISFDQHRIQPWTYQFAIGFLLLIFLKPPRAVRAFRLFVISIYFYSALSKCDTSFVQTLGPQLVEGLFSGIGIATTFWSERTFAWIASSFFIAEFLIAIGLFIPRTRKWTLWAAVLMHVCLMIAVGPWGLNHHQGVIIWNIYFIVQDLIIFGPWFERKHFQAASSSDTDRNLSLKAVSGTERCAMLVAWTVMLAPLFEPTGYFDHWPAWGLYASHHDRVTLFIDEEDKAALPSSLQPFVDPPQPLSQWCRVRVDRWSLAELDVPVYPQARFQLGVAIAVGRFLERHAEKINEPPQLKLFLEGAAHRMTGKRDISEHTGLKQVELLTRQFWFNAEPRSFGEVKKANHKTDSVHIP